MDEPVQMAAGVGKPAIFTCPLCGRIGVLDDDRFRGRVETRCFNALCDYHETVNWRERLHEHARQGIEGRNGGIVMTETALMSNEQDERIRELAIARWPALKDNRAGLNSNIKEFLVCLGFGFNSEAGAVPLTHEQADLVIAKMEEFHSDSAMGVPNI